MRHARAQSVPVCSQGVRDGEHGEHLTAYGGLRRLTGSAWHHPDGHLVVVLFPLVGLALEVRIKGCGISKLTRSDPGPGSFVPTHFKMGANLSTDRNRCRGFQRMGANKYQAATALGVCMCKRHTAETASQPRGHNRVRRVAGRSVCGVIPPARLG